MGAVFLVASWHCGLLAVVAQELFQALMGQDISKVLSELEYLVWLGLCMFLTDLLSTNLLLDI
jgi:hypothetical protein